jgi:hypothetical protein
MELLSVALINPDADLRLQHKTHDIPRHCTILPQAYPRQPPVTTMTWAYSWPQSLDKLCYI